MIVSESNRGERRESKICQCNQPFQRAGLVNFKVIDESLGEVFRWFILSQQPFIILRVRFWAAHVAGFLQFAKYHPEYAECVT